MPKKEKKEKKAKKDEKKEEKEQPRSRNHSPKRAFTPPSDDELEPLQIPLETTRNQQIKKPKQFIVEDELNKNKLLKKKEVKNKHKKQQSNDNYKQKKIDMKKDFYKLHSLVNYPNTTYNDSATGLKKQWNAFSTSVLDPFSTPEERDKLKDRFEESSEKHKRDSGFGDFYKELLMRDRTSSGLIKFQHLMKRKVNNQNLKNLK